MNFRLWGRLASIMLVLFMTGNPAAATEPPKAVASIRPIYSLLAAIMDGAATPELLLADNASPHDFVLKPSQAQMLQNAQLVVWVGPALETSLQKPLAELAKHASIITAMDLPELALLDYRQATDFDGHGEHDDNNEDHDEHETGDSHGHSHGDSHGGGKDPHIWLDPVNASFIASNITAALSHIDPQRAELYRSNLARLLPRLEQLDQQLTQQLAAYKNRPFITFHDGFQYFNQRYELDNVAVVALDPGRQPGVAHVMKLQKLIGDKNIACLFSEPQFQPRLVTRLNHNTGIKTASLDPLGASIVPGPQLYENMLRNIAGSIVDCLK